MGFRDWYYESIDLSHVNTSPYIDHLVRQAIKWMDWSGGDGEGFREMAQGDLEQSGEEEPSDEQIEARALEIAKEDLTDRLYDTIWQYQQFGSPIRLFREITVPGKSKQEIIKNISLMPIGPFWAHTESAAEAHWGHYGSGQVKVVLYTEVSPQGVHWEHTLIKNILPSYVDEKEVELRDGLHIHITKMKVANKWMNVNLMGFI